MFVATTLKICEFPYKCKTIKLVTKKKRGRQPKALPALQRQATDNQIQSDTSIQLSTRPKQTKSKTKPRPTATQSDSSIEISPPPKKRKMLHNHH